MTCIDVDALEDALDPERGRELAKATNRIRDLEAQVTRLREHTQGLMERSRTLSTQLRGGDRDCDPRTDVDHPGHVLIELGWKYVPDEADDPDDEIGAYWHDPDELRRTGRHSVMPITMALAIACRRLAGLRTKRGDPQSWLERVNDG
jgi:hypothetical protein